MLPENTREDCADERADSVAIGSATTEATTTASTPEAAEDCDSSCSSCGSDCSSRTEDFDPHIRTNDFSTVKHTIAVVSGKGGVGKSLVTSLLAAELCHQGYAVGILDADITGPSIPKAFGVEEKLGANEHGILPSVSAQGIKIVSTNLVLPEDTTPVLWRGSIISNLVRQFFSEVSWGELDYLLIDMPPGTGDVPLTVYQSIPIEGVVVVTAPQDLVSMIVGKAVNMAAMMQVPVLGLVENMAYFICPDCGGRHEVFGPSRLAEVAKTYGITLTAQLPICPELAEAMDAGKAGEIPRSNPPGLLHSLTQELCEKESIRA
jgi:Mrp family chromosome partitioning ATPase